MTKTQQTGLQTQSVTVTGQNDAILYEDTREQVVPVEIDLEPNEEVARIDVKYGITKQIVKFEFVRIDVGINLPAKAKKKNIEQVYNYAKGWVADKIDEILQEAMNASQSQ